MENQVIDEHILIRASVSAVWQALTDPNITEKYWGNTRIESDWQKGSSVLYRREGAITDKHVLQEIVPDRLIEHSFRPVFGEFEREAPSLVTILLTPEGPATRVSVLHRAFPPFSKVYVACSAGWPEVLRSLKAFLET